MSAAQHSTPCSTSATMSDLLDNLRLVKHCRIVGSLNGSGPGTRVCVLGHAARNSRLSKRVNPSQRFLWSSVGGA